MFHIFFPGFLLFWAVLVISVTFSVGIFKKEKRNLEDGIEKVSVFQNYKLLWEIIKLPNLKGLTIALLTTRVSRHFKRQY